MSKQEETAKNLEVIKDRDNFEKFLPILNYRTETHFYDYDNSYEFEFFDNKNISVFNLFFSNNEESKLWKIESL